MTRERDAVERRLTDLRNRTRPDELLAEVLAVTPDGDTADGEPVEIQLELSYVARRAPPGRAATTCGWPAIS